MTSSTTYYKSGSTHLDALFRSMHVWRRRAERPENLTKEAITKPEKLWENIPRKT